MKSLYWGIIPLLFCTACAPHPQLIELRGNPTTGYIWQLQNLTPTDIVHVDEGSYTPDVQPAGLVGGGGTFSFLPRCLSSGKATAIFAYHRPWEKEPPAETLRVHIICQKGETPSRLEKETAQPEEQ